MQRAYLHADRRSHSETTRSEKVSRMFSAYDMYLLPGGEDRGARLREEADAERLAASARREPDENSGRWWQQRLRTGGRHLGKHSAPARRVPVRP
jgi:hypothetical protein